MRCATLIVVALALAGCDAAGQADPVGTGELASPPGDGATCEKVASHATTVGEDFTRSLADEAISYRIAQARGELIQQGRRRVRVAERRTLCEKHLYLGPGLQEYHCVAEARVCGS